MSEFSQADKITWREMRQLIAEDLQVHKKWTEIGFRAVAVHRFGCWLQGLNNRLLRFAMWRVYWLLQRYVRNRGIEIPPQAHIGRRVHFIHQGAIVLHPAAVVGDGCKLRHGVTLGAASSRRSAEAPTLEAGVDVGAGAIILGGIRIGEGARIGANVVLYQDLPPGAVAVMDEPKIIIKPIAAD